MVERPEILYHYTSAAGLKGIVDGISMSSFPQVYATADHEHYSSYTYDRTLRFQASDVRFMNDHAELKAAGRIFAERIEHAATSAGGTHPLSPLAEELREHDFLPDPAQVFAISFSTERDDLSQWRGYAGGAGGFAIGIPSSVLADNSYPMFALPEPMNPMMGYPAKTELVEMSYDAADIPRAADVFIAAHSSMSVGSQEQLAQARFAMAKLLGGFKDAAFESEHEFRALTHSMPPAGSVPVYGETRIGGYGLIPYTAFAVNMGAAWRPASTTTIAELVVGPGPHQGLQVSAARQLLNTNGHDPDVVRPSPITFRG